MEKQNKKIHTKKSIDIVLNIILTVIFVLVLVIFINVVLSIGKGYTSFFGNSALNVVSNSMNGIYNEDADMADDNIQNGSAKGTYNYNEYFEKIKNDAIGENVLSENINSKMSKGIQKGDLIFIKVLSENDKKNLKVGDIVTFYFNINGKQVLNSHRIIKLHYSDTNQLIQITTKGDNNPESITEFKSLSDVVGIYNGKKIGGIGTVISFFNSSTGFLICVVIPSFLIVGYSVYLLIKALKEKNNEAKGLAELQLKLAIEKAQQEKEEESKKQLEIEKAKMREELLKEIEAEKTKMNQ